MTRPATTSIFRRGRASRWLAALAVVAAALPAVLAMGASPAAAAGSVSLSKYSGLTDGESIVVTGAGFNAGTPDSPKGIYLMFCQQTGGRPSGADCSGAQAWISDSPLAVSTPGSVRWGNGGSFSVSIPVAAAFGGVDCTQVTCGVVTRNDHMDQGATDQDSFTPVSFGAEPTTSTTEAPAESTTTTRPGDDDGPGTENDTRITLSKNSDLAGGEVINVSGTGFVADQGIYVQVCAAPEGTLGSAAGRAGNCYPEQDGNHTVWLTPVPSDGTWSTPLTVADAFGDVDCREQACGVFVRRDHSGGAADFSQDAFAPISFGDPSTTPTTTPGPVGARLTIAPASGITSGSTIRVEGAGFRAGHEIFVGVCDSAVANFAACDFASVQQVTVEHGGTARAGGPGTFVAHLVARSKFGGTDCSAAASRCAVATWAVSGNDAALEVTAPLLFAATGTSTPTGPRPTGSASGAPLARTGSESTRLALVGSLAILVGAGLYAASRRRLA